MGWLTSINKNYQRIQGKTKKCKYYESINSLEKKKDKKRAEKRVYPRSSEGLPPDTFDGILQHFFAEISMKDGKHFEHFSLAAIQSFDWQIFCMSQIMSVLYSTLDFPKDLEMC